MKDEEFALLHRTLLAASFPTTMRWIGAEATAAMFDVSTSHFMQRIACKPTFPKPARIDGGHPRWNAAEVAEWIERERAASPDKRDKAA